MEFGKSTFTSSLPLLRQHCLKPPSMHSGLSLNPSCPLKPLNLSSFNIKPASTKFSAIFWINFFLLELQKSNVFGSVLVLIVVFAFIHGTGFEIMVKFYFILFYIYIFWIYLCGSISSTGSAMFIEFFNFLSYMWGLVNWVRFRFAKKLFDEMSVWVVYFNACVFCLRFWATKMLLWMKPNSLLI